MQTILHICHWIGFHFNMKRYWLYNSVKCKMCFYLSLIRRGEIHPSTPQSVVNNITHFPLKKDIFVSVIKP